MAKTLSQTSPGRAAYSIDEFSQLFGHDRAWGYRMIKEKRIRAVTGYGKTLIPASEIARITEGEEIRP